jgi:multidrug efflux pump subunit AcrA (membrane-fusion protein)
MLLKKGFVPAVLIVVFGTAFYFLIHFKSKPAATPKQPKPVKVKSMRLVEGSYSPGVFLYGNVVSRQNANVKAELNSTVERVFFYPGARVKKGDKLIELDDAEVRLRWEEAKANLVEVKSKWTHAKQKIQYETESLQVHQQLLKVKKRVLERNLKLVDTKAISPQSLDRAQEVYLKQEAEFRIFQKHITLEKIKLKQYQAGITKAMTKLKLLTHELDSAEVTAPFDGLITHLSVSQGATVGIGQNLIELMGTEHVELQALIPTMYDQRIKDGLAASVRFKAQSEYHGKMIPLRLDRMAAQVNEGQVGRVGYFRVMSYPSGLGKQQTLPVLLLLSPKKNSFVVPASALYYTNTVYKITNHRLTSVPVQVVGRYFDHFEAKGLIVRSQALSAGDSILISSLPNAIAGLKVKPINRDNNG